MNFSAPIFRFDEELLIFLNKLGNNSWDPFWLQVTDKTTWIPMYVIVLIIFFKYYGWKKTIFTLLIIALLITFTDQLVNLVKETFERLRPNKDPEIREMIRVVKNSGGFSFFSGHATNSTAVALFIVLSLRSYTKWVFLLFIWPLLFAYSRIYLGVHYPLDIIAGILTGIIIGFAFYKVNQILLKKIKWKY